MKSLFSGAILALLPFLSVYSQLTGTVSNNQTNEAVEAARIYVPQLDDVAYSNASGAFTLHNIPTKPFNIIISRLGYQTVEVMVSSNQISISLDPSVFEMEEVIVSTPFSNLENQNTVAVSKINSEAIQESGASVLAAALQVLPGVSAITTGQGIAKPVIRGLSGNRVVTYLNDLRYENYQFSGDHGLDLGNTASSVEIIKGPFSLLYGSDAIGGVLYVAPQAFTIRESLTGSVQQRYVSQSFGSETSANLGVASGKWQFGVSGSHMQHADYETASEDFVPNSRYRSKSSGINTRFSDGNYQATARFAYSDKQAGIVEEPMGGKRNFDTQVPYQETQLNQFSLRQKLNTSLGLWDLTSGFTLNQRREFEEHEEEAHAEEEEHEEDAALNMHNRVLSFDLKNTLPTSEKWQQIAGIQWLQQQNINSGEERIIPDAIQRDFGVYWLHQFLGEKLKWQFGVRYDTRKIDTEAFEIHDHDGGVGEKVDKVNRSINSLNGSAGFTYPVSEKINLRINASTGFRAPNLAELTSHGVHHGTQRFEVGNAELKPEQNLQFDLGIDIKTSYLNMGLDGFYNTMKNYIFLNPTEEMEEGLQVFEYTQTNASLWGGEFFVHYHPQGQLHFESALEYVRGKQSNHSALPLMPPFAFHQEIHWEVSPVFAAFVSIDMVDNQNNVSRFETTTKAYEVVNLGGHLDIPFDKNRELRIQLLIRNLGNTNYVPHLSRLKGIGVEQPGRNFVLSANITF